MLILYSKHLTIMTQNLASFTCAPSNWELIDIKFPLQESFCYPAKLENFGEHQKKVLTLHQHQVFINT